MAICLLCFLQAVWQIEVAFCSVFDTMFVDPTRWKLKVCFFSSAVCYVRAVKIGWKMETVEPFLHPGKFTCSCILNPNMEVDG